MMIGVYQWMMMTKMEEKPVAVTVVAIISSHIFLHLNNVVRTIILVEIEWRIRINFHPRFRIVVENKIHGSRSRRGNGRRGSTNSSSIISSTNIQKIDQMNVAHYSVQPAVVIIEITMSTVVGMVTIPTPTCTTPHLLVVEIRKTLRKPSLPNGNRSRNVVVERRKNYVICTRPILHRKKKKRDSVGLWCEVHGGRNVMVDGRGVMTM
jgi:hypothetical protein